MNKAVLIKKVVEALRNELLVYFRAANNARAEATHEQSKPENKYDTRGLEASYLARGQSKQAMEIENAIVEFEKLPLRPFKATDPIDMGAVVELEQKREKTFYFLGPKAGGTEVTLDKKEILVITPQSPLGSQLMGKKQGERLQLEIAGTRSEYIVKSVE